MSANFRLRLQNYNFSLNNARKIIKNSKQPYQKFRKRVEQRGYREHQSGNRVVSEDMRPER